MATDPVGECLGFNDEPCYETANRWAAKLQRKKQDFEVDGTGWGSIALNTLSGSAVDAVELFLVDPLRAGASTGEAVGSGAGAFDVALATLEDAGRVAVLAGGAGATVKAAGRGAKGLRRAVSLSDEIGDAVSVGLREGAAEGVAQLTPLIGTSSVTRGSRLLPAVTETTVQNLSAKAAERGLALSRHAIERLAVREADVSLTAVQRTIQRGQKFLDPKNNSRVSILERGMASGESILIAQNPETGLITTVLTGKKLIRSRFVLIP